MTNWFHFNSRPFFWLARDLGFYIFMIPDSLFWC